MQKYRITGLLSAHCTANRFAYRVAIIINQIIGSTFLYTHDYGSWPHGTQLCVIMKKYICRIILSFVSNLRPTTHWCMLPFRRNSESFPLLCEEHIRLGSHTLLGEAYTVFQSIIMRKLGITSYNVRKGPKSREAMQDLDSKFSNLNNILVYWLTAALAIQCLTKNTQDNLSFVYTLFVFYHYLLRFSKKKK